MKNKFITISVLLIFFMLMIFAFKNPWNIPQLTTFKEKTKSFLELEESNTLATKKDLHEEKPSSKEYMQAPELNQEYIKDLLSHLSDDEHAKVLGDLKLFNQVIDNEIVNNAIVAAAIANKVDRNEKVKVLVRRSVDNIIRESYMNTLLKNNFPASFPTEEQMVEYYENNKENFFFPERIHVWQIFFKKTDNDEHNKEALKRAQNVFMQLKKNEEDFNGLAKKHSEHEQSRILNGYLGVFNVSELLPEVKDSLLKLKFGDISSPVESKNGFHIVKRGDTVAKENLSFETVKNSIRKTLIKQARVKIREEIANKISEEFAQKITKSTIEEWFSKLNE